VMRNGAVKHTWMIWDRTIRGPAKLEPGALATGLAEKQARELIEKLKRACGEE